MSQQCSIWLRAERPTTVPRIEVFILVTSSPPRVFDPPSFLFRGYYIGGIPIESKAATARYHQHVSSTELQMFGSLPVLPRYLRDMLTGYLLRKAEVRQLRLQVFSVLCMFLKCDF